MMKIAAICITYKRPGLLATAVECFLRQDYPAGRRELIVVDDAGQYACRGGDGWRLVSVPVRFRTLGEKRNAAAALASGDVDAYCVWDDDDVYLPWHMSATAAALESADYSIPSVLYTEEETGLERKANRCLFHGGWAFRRDAFERAGGYPFIDSGEDQELLGRFRAADLRGGDPLDHEPRPSYIYRWHTTGSPHISAMGQDGYEQLGRAPAERALTVTPRWDVDWVAMAAAVENSPP